MIVSVESTMSPGIKEKENSFDLESPQLVDLEEMRVLKIEVVDTQANKSVISPATKNQQEQNVKIQDQ
jgi:hypothetical protein